MYYCFFIFLIQPANVRQKMSKKGTTEQVIGKGDCGICGYFTFFCDLLFKGNYGKSSQQKKGSIFTLSHRMGIIALPN